MKVTSIKKIKYFFILSSVFLSLDTFSVDWVEINFTEKKIRPQIVMSDLEPIVTDYITEKYGVEFTDKKKVDKIHLWAIDENHKCDEITFLIDDINLTTQLDHAKRIELKLADVLALYAKGEKREFERSNSPHRILKNPDGSKEYIKFGIENLQLTATKEFFEKLLKELQPYKDKKI